MLTDLAEVARLGSEKRAENLAFRRWLHELHVPEREFQLIATAIQPHIDCTACANCCRHSTVPVDEAELAVIAAYAGIAIDVARHRYACSDPDDSRRMILRSNSRGCTFLEDGLCLIYDARPRACRDFPHVAPGARTLGARAESHARWAALCPIIFNALEEEKRRRGFHHGGPLTLRDRERPCTGTSGSGPPDASDSHLPLSTPDSPG